MTISYYREIMGLGHRQGYPFHKGIPFISKPPSPTTNGPLADFDMRKHLNASLKHWEIEMKQDKESMCRMKRRIMKTRNLWHQMRLKIFGTKTEKTSCIPWNTCWLIGISIADSDNPYSERIFSSSPKINPNNRPSVNFQRSTVISALQNHRASPRQKPWCSLSFGECWNISVEFMVLIDHFVGICSLKFDHPF